MIRFINQPEEQQLGTILMNQLANGHYRHFIIISAFAKNSGVLRIKEAIQSFRETGGAVDAFIGVDAHGTSYEAVCNLFSFVDNLYIIHDRSLSVTFHPKAYYLTDLADRDWLALGSNNLTGGGLWTNAEWATIVETSNNASADELAYFESFIRQIGLYKTERNGVSKKIESLDDIDTLLNADLLRREIQLQVEAAHTRRTVIQRNDVVPDPFGTNGVATIPRVQHEGQPRQRHRITIQERNTQVTAIEPIVPTDSSEKMWFETRQMTGGSRNILDLSMLGSLIQGSGAGTRYMTDRNAIILGSVVFFDIDPTDTTLEKNITINYNAQDYSGCTIKMHNEGANPNGSWRIQLKGETEDGHKLTTAEEGEWFVHKIIVLEKIRTDYYVMSVLEEASLDSLKQESLFVARNGRNPASKQYGLLNI